MAFPALADDLIQPPWRGEGRTTYQQWTFDDDDDPAEPETYDNPYGVPTADIVVGEVGEGWLAGGAPLFLRQGLWDLGREGTITIDIDNRDELLDYKEIWIQITYLLVPTNAPSVDVLGGTLLQEETVLVEEDPPFSSWYLHSSVWRIEPNPNHEQIVMTGDWFGSLIDQVVVDTICTDEPSCDPDLDGDTDVDVNDFLTFAACFNGSLNPPQPGCASACADMDGDGDVDVTDFLTFASCFNGSLNPPAAACFVALSH